MESTASSFLILMAVMALASSQPEGTPPCAPPQEGQDYPSRCTKPGDGRACSGRGTCVCGQCECQPIRATIPGRRWSGQYCQCNDYSCDYFRGELCGGPARGRCQCGICMCTQGYQGDYCACPKSTETCRAANGLICNGKGRCECGQCVCEGIYRGTTCDDCPTCPGRCSRHKVCVQCSVFGSGPYGKEECHQKCSNIRKVDQVQVTDNRRLCRFRDDDYCVFQFAYDLDHEFVYAERKKVCPPPATTPASGAASSGWPQVLLLLSGMVIYGGSI